MSIVKHNFYNGELVTTETMNNLETYIDTTVNTFVSDTLGLGIIEGFEVAVKNTAEIQISPGKAYNSLGERLNLENDCTISLSEFLPQTDTKTVFLSMKKDYIGQDPILDHLGQTVYKTLIPTVSFQITDIKPEHPYYILSSITLDVQGITGINSESTLFQTFAKIKDIIYPIGYQYTQYPNSMTGQFESGNSPNTLFGGIWELRFNDKGIFFRTEGGDSGESRDESTGVQDTAIQHHKHDVGIGGHNHTVSVYAHVGGNKGNGSYSNFNWTNQTTSWFDYGTKRSTDIVEGKRTSTETRPVNMLMRIWQRIA
ncbi:MAG: hypothetical protein ACRCTQ_06620 [Brevinemataceae bacterium]